jgi:N-methylhydantoinase B
MASSNDVLPAIVFSGRHRRHKRTYVHLETLGGGAGARLDRDGQDGIQVHVTNTSNLRVEALENEYPLLVEEYGLVPGSGGAGHSRGGLGIVRQIRALDDGTVFGCRSDSHLTGAEGVFGGMAGAPGRLIRNPAAGESMRIETPAAAALACRRNAAPTGMPLICAAARCQPSDGSRRRDQPGVTAPRQIPPLVIVAFATENKTAAQ